MSESVSFDRAAEFYDETRADPPHVANALTEALLAELEKAGADRVLEIGIGTGRIARPLAERGIRVTGFDIAPRMVAKLREQLTPQHVAPDVSFGDATALPVKDVSFRAALGVHILHLVSSLEGAVAEIKRALAPGGVYLSPYLRFSDEPWRAGFAKWDELVAQRDFVPRHRPREAEINAAVSRALGERRDGRVRDGHRPDDAPRAPAALPRSRRCVVVGLSGRRVRGAAGRVRGVVSVAVSGAGRGVREQDRAHADDVEARWLIASSLDEATPPRTTATSRRRVA